MIREIVLKGVMVKYNFEIKNVKNINLRIKPDGTIYVSANRFTPLKTVENFIKSKEDAVINALKKFDANKSNVLLPLRTEEETRALIEALCIKYYPYFKEKGVAYPDIKFKKMKSIWGSCNIRKSVLSFNILLMYVPEKCVEYVVVHELCHFLEANHSARFYKEVEKIFPSWKYMRKTLNKFSINVLVEK